MKMKGIAIVTMIVLSSAAVHASESALKDLSPEGITNSMSEPSAAPVYSVDRGMSKLPLSGAQSLAARGSNGSRPETGKAGKDKITSISCKGTSKSDNSTSSVYYRFGDTTAEVQVSRTVCTYWGLMPVGCMPQNTTLDLHVISKSVTPRAISLVLNNKGTDLDINVEGRAPGAFSGTWFAHENNYTYHLVCEVE